MHTSHAYGKLQRVNKTPLISNTLSAAFVCSLWAWLSLTPEARAADICVQDNTEDVLSISNTSDVQSCQWRLSESGQPAKTYSTTQQRGLPYAAAIASAAEATMTDAALLHAVIKTESAYQPQARSPRGAQGLMQLMPATARQLGVSDLRDPAQNILAGARYLSQLRQQFNDDLPLALAAYNAGPAAVIRHGNTIPPYAETRAYVPRVMQEYQRLLRQY